LLGEKERRREGEKERRREGERYLVVFIAVFMCAECNIAAREPSLCVTHTT
jgi:hypothetical protein